MIRLITMMLQNAPKFARKIFETDVTRRRASKYQNALNTLKLRINIKT